VRKLAVLGFVALCAALSVVPGRPAAAGGRAWKVLPLRFAAGPGALDRSFGGTGKVSTDFGQLDELRDLAVQRDGKIVAAGSATNPLTYLSRIVVARYRLDGSLDPRFGVGGRATVGVSANEFATAIALQRDGKIVVAGGAVPDGSTDAEILVARFNPDGSLDGSFGAGGKVLTDLGSKTGLANGLVIQPDGKLVVVGSARGANEASEFVLVRYQGDGSLDPTFGGDGEVFTAFAPGYWNLGKALALARGGRIVAAGWALPGGAGGPGRIDVARYNADGMLDTSFADGGKLVSAPGTDNGAFGVLALPDGKVVVGGFVDSSFAVARYTVDGKPDPAFPLTLGPWRGGIAYDLVRQNDGKLLVSGTASNSTLDRGPDFALIRLERSGELDQSFHGGRVSTDFGGLDEATALAVSGTKIVAGGSTSQLNSNYNITSQDFALARYAGAAPRCVVPSLRGRILRRARSALAKAHCGLGQVRRAASTSVPRGRVISQRPTAGRSLANGTKVNLVVSRGQR
jgi:uncharacterized delta-60 repeat protein